MKRATTPNQECENASLKVLKRVEKEVRLDSGRLEKLSYWQQSTKNPEADTRIKFPVYDRARDGNVFDWLISTADDFRKIRQRERLDEFKKISEKSKVMDRTKVAD